MIKHTPGPWICYADYGFTEEDNFPMIQNRYGVSPIRGIDPENDYEIAEVHANAFLIAAAPDLLKELKNLQAIICESCGPIDYDTNCTEHSDACYQATLAIEKAEGKV
jgi:hypothetical protein